MSKMDDEKTMIVDNEAIEEAAKESSSIAGTDLIGGSGKAIVDSKTSEPPQPKIDIEEGNLGNDSGDDEGDEEDEDDEDLDYYYYSFAEEVNDEDRINAEGQLNNNDDPEYFSYECLSPLEAENFLQESVAVVTASVTVSYSTMLRIRTYTRGGQTGDFYSTNLGSLPKTKMDLSQGVSLKFKFICHLCGVLT